MSDAVLQAVIQGHARQLRTPTIARECAAVARRAQDEGWPYEEYLRELLEAELRNRQENAARRYMRLAGFPDLKTFEQIQWDALHGVLRPKLMELASCRFVEASEDVVIGGGSCQAPHPGRVPQGRRTGSRLDGGTRRTDAVTTTPALQEGATADCG